MIRSFFFILLALIFCSCTITGRIVEISDPSKEIQGIKMIQHLIAQSTEDSILSHSVSMIYLLEHKNNERPILFLDVQIEIQLSTDQLDSVMILKLDNEELRIEANEFKEFPNNKTETHPVMSGQFPIPENLWVPIVYSDEIQYRFFNGKEGIDVKLTRKETSKLKEYFNRAIQLRDANLPPIPEGQKKW